MLKVQNTDLKPGVRSTCCHSLFLASKFCGGLHGKKNENVVGNLYEIFAVKAGKNCG
jgi:hypothetical protein